MKKRTQSKVADKVLKNEYLNHIPAVNWGIDEKDTDRQQYTMEMLSVHQSWADYQFAVSTSSGFTRWLCKL